MSVPSYYNAKPRQKPIVVPVGPRGPRIYSTNEWRRMTEHDDSDNYAEMARVTKEAYALHQTLERSLYGSRTYTDGSLAHMTDHKQSDNSSQEPKLYLAGASWCGHTKLAKQIHAKQGIGDDEIKYLECAGKDKSHPACKQTKGFPTYYEKQGSTYVVKHRGRTNNPKALLQ